jgi:ABC-type spermidine/putrescine transport system permease subunit I
VAGTGPFANFEHFFTNTYYQQVLTRTLRFALIATVLSLAIGYPASLAFRRLAERLGSTAILIITLPIFAGAIVVVVGWMSMMTSRGLIGGGLTELQRLLGLGDEPINLLETDFAVILAIVHFNLAFVILNLLNVVLRIDPELEEAAMNLGANSWQTFRHVIWPLSLPGVFSASLIAFAISMNAFVVPTFLGNDARLVMTTQIVQFMRTAYNIEMASATTVILLLISMGIMVLYGKFFSGFTRT